MAGVLEVQTFRHLIVDAILIQKVNDAVLINALSQHDNPAKSHNEPMKISSHFPQNENGQAAFNDADLLDISCLPDA